MVKLAAKRAQRVRRKLRLSKVSRVRLSVFISNANIHAQLIDDQSSKTIASSSTKLLKLKSANIDSATKVGSDIANKAKEANINTIVYDRGGYLYHGKVKALAEAARENGLKF
ncbi:MAG: 50S ribosomal protein L18 [Alphaproteobacteria bacterium]|jgi:large subunit ribosomal protein L18|nr:50S ribosomal protein L18 [Alphaproteobacteria bacterium]